MSLRSIVLLGFQFLTMGYLLSDFTLNNSFWILGTQALGVVIAISGIAAGGVDAFNMQPEVRSEHLITNGIYKWIRNPMYLGILIFFLIDVISNQSILRWTAYSILLIALILKIRSEEHFLALEFGDDYLDYKSKTFRLIPLVF